MCWALIWWYPGEPIIRDKTRFFVRENKPKEMLVSITVIRTFKELENNSQGIYQQAKSLFDNISSQIQEGGKL